MKTLIIDGSTRAGDTHALIDALTSRLRGEVRIVSAADGIAPCTDCRYCQKHVGCAVHDGMSEIYRWLDACDNVVIASPVWFSSLSGPALDIASRLQTYFAARRFRGEPPARERRGAILLAGGHPGSEAGAIRSARLILRYVGVREPLVVTSMDTDRLPAHLDEAALTAARDAAELLNQKGAVAN